MSGVQEYAKKRPRVQSACTICRRRKVKCDKSKPACLVCVRHNVTYLCEYSEPEWAAIDAEKLANPKRTSRSTSEQQQEPRSSSQSISSAVDAGSVDGSKKHLTELPDIVVELENKIQHLESELSKFRQLEFEKSESDSDIITFGRRTEVFDSALQSISNINVLSCRNFFENDPVYFAFFKNAKLPETRTSPSLQYEVLNWKPLYGADKISDWALEKRFKNKVLETLSITLGVGHSLNKASQINYDKTEKNLPIRLDNSSESSLESDLKLLRRMRSVLPPRKTVWLLVDRFFKYVHPLAPYLDQQAFYDNLTSIIGERSDLEEKIELNIAKRLDLMMVSLLLLTIYLGSLTLVNNSKRPYDGFQNDPDIKFLLSNPIDYRNFTMTDLCGSPFQTTSFSSFRAIQVMMYHRVAMKCSPEDAFVIESDTYAATTMQIALSLGLHRDPSNYEMKVAPKQVNIWRKMWYAVSSSTLFQNFRTDTFFSRFTEYDTKLPVFLGALNSNNLDLDNEKASISIVRDRYLLSQHVHGISTLVMNLRESPKLKVILQKVKELENLAQEITQPIEIKTLSIDMPTDTNSTRLIKVNNFIVYLESSCLLMCLYQHIYLHYEEKSQRLLAFTFFKKILTTLLDSFNNCSKAIGKLSDYFGTGYDWAVTPDIITTLLRLQWFMIAMILRLKHMSYIYHVYGKITKEIDEVINELVGYLIGLYRSCISIYNQLSGYYYYAWRFSKLQSFLFNKLIGMINDVLDTTKEPSEKQKGFENNIFPDLSMEELIELVQIFKIYLTDSFREKWISGLDTSSETSNNVNQNPGTEMANLWDDTSVDTEWIDKMINNKMESFINLNNNFSSKQFLKKFGINDPSFTYKDHDFGQESENQSSNSTQSGLSTAGFSDQLRETHDLVTNQTSSSHANGHPRSIGSQFSQIPGEPTNSGDCNTLFETANPDSPDSKLKQLFDELDETLRFAIIPDLDDI